MRQFDEDCERTEREMTRLEKSVTWLAALLLALTLVGCEWGIGERAAPIPSPPATPMPPATPLPPSASGAGAVSSDQKLVEGYLYVRYFPPCALRGAPAEWVAPIELTDLRSRSVVHLNGNGTIKASPKPDYKTEEGKAAIEAALKDDSIVKQIVARPDCVE